MTTEQKEKILRTVGKMPIKEIAELAGVHHVTAKTFLNRKGISSAFSRQIHKLTNSEIDYIKENYGQIPAGEIADHLGLTKNQITSAAQRYGWAKKTKIDDVSDDDRSLIVELVSDGIPVDETAKKMNVSIAIVNFLTEVKQNG